MIITADAKDPKPTEKILSSNLLTAKQVVAVYSFAGMTKDTLPKKKSTAVILAPAGKVYFRITKSEFKSTYNERLFRVEQIQSGASL
jgi:hypothetical protein